MAAHYPAHAMPPLQVGRIDRTTLRPDFVDTAAYAALLRRALAQALDV